MREPREAENLSASPRASGVARLCAAVIAALGWSALGIEVYFTVAGAAAKNETVAAALIRFFSFFTIQTNLLLALMLTMAAATPDADTRPGRAGLKAATVVYVVVVGAVYAILLSHLYQFKGYVLFADRILHDVIPILYPVYWLAFAPKGGVRRSDPFLWLIFPILYFIYTLIRGALIGAYPYPFLDVGKLGVGQVVINAFALLAAFLALGFMVAAIDGALAAQKGRGRRALGSAADF
jgi:hypothetical protein